jgi:hypothetical protein
MRCVVAGGDRHIDLALLQQPHQKCATRDVNDYANLWNTIEKRRNNSGRIVSLAPSGAPSRISPVIFIPTSDAQASL